VKGEGGTGSAARAAEGALWSQQMWEEREPRPQPERGRLSLASTIVGADCSSTWRRLDVVQRGHSGFSAALSSAASKSLTVVKAIVALFGKRF